MLILTIHTPTIIRSEFSISIECDGYQADVRPGERAALFPDGWAIISAAEQSAPVTSTTAYDRVDDRTFQGDFNLPA